MLLANKGVPLVLPGLSDTALTRADALYAVELLRLEAVSILGGDVYLRRGTKIDLAYANWRIDREVSEQENEYLRRSWDSTERYIINYPEPADGEPLFVLVIDENRLTAPPQLQHE